MSSKCGLTLVLELPGFFSKNHSARRSSSPPLSDQRPGASSLQNEPRRYPAHNGEYAYTDDGCLNKANDLPDPSDLFPAKRSTSPPLDYCLARRALARRGFTLRDQKPGTSPRDENSAPAEDEELALENSSGSPSNANPQEEVFEIFEKDGHGGKKTWFGTVADAAKAGKPVGGVRFCRKIKSRKEGATKEETALVEPESTGLTLAPLEEEAVADKDSHTSTIASENDSIWRARFTAESLEEDSLVPSFKFEYDANGNPRRFLVKTIKGQQMVPKFREKGLVLTRRERMNTPDEFVNYNQSILASLWDMSYDPLIRTKVLGYNLDLNLAGKEDRMMDWSHNLLTALVHIPIPQANVREGAKHLVDASESKISNNKSSTAGLPEESAKLSHSSPPEIIWDTLNEHSDPALNSTHSITTARTKPALSQGVNPFLLVEKSNTEGSKPTMEDPVTSKDKGKEGPVTSKYKGKEGSVISKDKDNKGLVTSKDKDNEGLVTSKDKGKAKEGYMLEGSANISEKESEKKATKKGKGKNIDLPKDRAQTGKGKSKEHDTIAESSKMGNKKEGEPLTKDPVHSMADFEAISKLIDNASRNNAPIDEDVTEDIHAIARTIRLAMGVAEFKGNNGLFEDVAIDTPAVTASPKKQQKFNRRNTITNKHKEVRRAADEAIMIFDQKMATLAAQMKADTTGRPFKDVYDELMDIGTHRARLKEAIRLNEAGGTIADRLAQRLKKLAEGDGAARILYEEWE